MSDGLQHTKEFADSPRKWWAIYASSLVALGTFIPLAVNLIPGLHFAIESGTDVLVVLLVAILVPAAISTIILWVATRMRPSKIRSCGTVAGVIVLIVSLFVCRATNGTFVDRLECNFGYLTGGEVWIKVQPVDQKDTPDRYTVRIQWGPFRNTYQYSSSGERYLVMNKYDYWANESVTAAVQPSARLTCGTSLIPGDAEKVKLGAWTRCEPKTTSKC